MGDRRRAAALAGRSATGIGGMAAFFLAPNMLIFGIFVLLPLRHQLRLLDDRRRRALPRRPQSMSAPSSTSGCSTCANYLDPQRCREDRFWIAVRNTGWFVVVQVRADDRRGAGHRAGPQPRARRRAASGAPCSSFPVLLSPVVVGLIWSWILQRQGLLNFARL